MEKENWISLEEFCSSHHLEISFIYDLQQYELLDVTTIGENTYLSPDQLAKAEKMANMHAEMGINPEGIEAIVHLLSRVERMQQEITRLRNRLILYEGE